MSSLPWRNKLSRKNWRYKYRSLRNVRSLRLLKFHTGQSDNRENGSIAFDLFEFSLETAPNFLAMSYTWDDQKPTEAVYCNGHAFRVTANCAAILEQVLSRAPDSYVWIDSICIDQDSLSERAQQVRLMAEIYTNASEVWIWLGEVDEALDQAMDLIGKMSALATTAPDQVEETIRLLQEQAQLEFFEQYQTCGIPRGALFTEKFMPYFHPLIPVIQRPWFFRIWTLQEVVLAEKAIIVYGDKSMDWSKLSLLTSTLTEASATSGFTLYPGDALQRVRVVEMLRDFLHLGERLVNFSFRLPKEHPLGEVGLTTSEIDALIKPGIASHYFLASSLLCSQPQDKAFGAYAILQKHGIRLQAPDYEKPEAMIYTETARAVIEHDSSLELLYYISTPRTLDDLPSWVPDPTTGEIHWVPGFEFTSSTGSSEAKFKFNKRGELSIFGTRIDSVKATSKTMRVDNPFGEIDIRLESDFIKHLGRIFPMLQNWINFAESAACPDAQHPLLALCTTVMQEIAFAFSKDKKSMEQLVQKFSDWASIVLSAGVGQEKKEEEELLNKPKPLSRYLRYSWEIHPTKKFLLRLRGARLIQSSTLLCLLEVMAIVYLAPQAVVLGWESAGYKRAMKYIL